MVAQIVAQVIGKLGSILAEELKQRGRLVLGAEKDVKKLTSTFTAIEALLLDAEERQLSDKGVEDWLKKLKNISYEIDDVVDDWRTEILKRQLEGNDDDDGHENAHNCLVSKLLQVSDLLKRVCPFIPAYCFSPDEIGLRYDIASRIKVLNESLDDVAKDKDMFMFTPREGKVYQSLQTSPNMGNFSFVKGREEERRTLLLKLLNDDHPSVESLSVQGTGGLGKTTLAKLLFNDEEVEAYFEVKIWVCVSETFDQAAVVKAMLESLGGSTASKVLSSLLKQVHDKIKGKRFLLVLDDVWEDSRSKWEEIRDSVSRGSRGSKMLVTTRKEEVSRAFGCADANVLRIKKMSDDVCGAIFAQVVFSGWSRKEQEHVKDLCEEMVRKCYGSPLAAKVLGGILQFKKTRKEWSQVLKSKMWQLKEAREEVFGPLALSYYDLPSGLRQCFQFCAVFPSDFEMEKGALIKLWMANGFLTATKDQDMEGVGEDYFRILVMRSFFQDFEQRRERSRERTYCKMHDLVHNFAQLVSKCECLSVTSRDVKDLTTTAPYIPCHGVRHLMVQNLQGVSTTINTPLFTSTQHLGSFTVMSSVTREWSTNADVIQLEAFTEWQGLRSLVIHNFLQRVPPTINRLHHLRHLDLSHNVSLQRLPDEICELYNLETLVLNGNKAMWWLPREMGNKLANLKHLENQDVAAALPTSMGRLTGLKSLTEFKVEQLDDGGGTNIGVLADMNQLTGSLYVAGLCLAFDCDEVRRAQFSKKAFLTVLWLKFNDDYPKWDHPDEEQVMEAVVPPTGLEELVIRDYRGKSISPSWLMLLSNLTRLTIALCHRLERLPALGDLPSLEQLSLRTMPNVTKVGAEFLQGTTTTVNSAAAFAKLTELQFYNLSEWEEWEEDETMMESSKVIMPMLSSLSVTDCRGLKKLPGWILRKTTLERLEIHRSGGFERYRFDYQHPEMLPSEVWDRISHIPNVVFDRINVRTRFLAGKGE